MRVKKIADRVMAIMLAMAMVVSLGQATTLTAYAAKPSDNPSYGDKQGGEYIRIFLNNSAGKEVTPVSGGESPKIYLGDKLYCVFYSPTSEQLMAGSDSLGAIKPTTGWSTQGTALIFNAGGSYTLQFGQVINDLFYFAKINITVESESRPAENVQPTGITITPSENQTISNGETIQFTGAVQPSNANDKTMSWEVKPVDGITAGTITSDGLFTATRNGISDIVVTSTTGSYTATTRVFVGEVCTALGLDKTSVDLVPGGFDTITVTTTPVNVYNKISISCNSSDIIAAYDESTKQLKITAINNGNTNTPTGITGVVTVTCGSFTKTINVTAKAAYDPTVVSSISASNINMVVGDTAQINAVVSPETAYDKSVTYESDNQAVATVSSTGEVSGLSVGTAGITIKSVSNPSVTKQINVVVTKRPEPAQITLSADSTPTNDSVAINISSTGDVKYMVLPNGNIVDSNEFTYNVLHNGTYSFTVVGITGNRTTKSIVIDCIDKTPPTLLINSKLSTDGTDYTVNALDLNSGVKHIIMPDGTRESSLPAMYKQTSDGEVTFAAQDNAGNITSKSSVRSVVTIPNASSDTYVTYEGVPTEWTNKSANINVAAYNPIDGIELQLVNASLRSDPTGDGTNATTNVVYASTIMEDNGTINAVVTDGSGRTKVVPITVDKIDKVVPTASHTVDGETISVTASDDASGIKAVTLPDGTTQETSAVSFSTPYNGTYRFLLEDNAGNISAYDVETTGLEEPAEPITPPDESFQSSDVVIIGTVEPDPLSPDAGLIGVIVPTRMDFIIDSNRNFISGKYNFENTGDVDLDITIKEVTPATGTETQLVSPDTFADWPNISIEEARANLGLKLGTVDLSKKNQLLVSLAAGAKEPLGLSGWYGHKWGNVNDLILRYNMTLEIEAITNTPDQP